MRVDPSRYLPLMTEEERKACHEWVAKSRRAQGLPPTVTDPEVLAKVAEIVQSESISTSSR